MLEKIAFQKGLISKEEFKKAVAACKASDNYEASLEAYFLSNRILTQKTIDQLVSALAAIRILKKNKKFGERALKLGLIDIPKLKEALDTQRKAVAEKKPPRLVGQILLEQGILSKEQIALITDGSKQADSSEKKSGPGKKKNRALVREIEGGMIFEIDEDAMAGYLTKTENFDDAITAEVICRILSENKIQYGIADDKTLEGFINSSGFRTQKFKAVSGTPMVRGHDGMITYYFDTDYLTAGGMDEDGNIDFKDRGKIPKVEKGELLAKKTAPKASRDGRDIFGETVEADPVKDVELKTRTGAFFSDDGLKLYASISGFPKLSWSGHIDVLAEFKVKGDVGYETGHVTYDGDIDVVGCLKSGFCISGNNIRVQEVDGGRIIARGDVIIVNGVNDAQIRAKGSVSAKFVHHSSILSLGNVNIEKEIVDSGIDTSGSCRIATGEMINCEISAKKGVLVKNLGTEKTNPNTIKAGQSIYTKKELKQIEKKKLSIQKEKEILEKKKANLKRENDSYTRIMSGLSAELDKAGYETYEMQKRIEKLSEKPEHKKEIKLLNRQIRQNHVLFERLEKELSDSLDFSGSNAVMTAEIESRFVQLDEDLMDLELEEQNYKEWVQANKGDPIITIEGKAFADTIISTPHAEKILKEPFRRVTFKEVEIRNKDRDYSAYEIQCHDNLKRT